MEVIIYIQTFKTPFLDYFFQIITMAGEQPFFILLVCWFTWCYDKESGWRIGFIFLTGVALGSVLKDIFRVARPIGYDNIKSLRLHTAKGYSFPSGHTQSAALSWFSLMKIYGKTYLYIIGTVIVLMVGLSRLYLGVHWLSDVIGGAFIGAAWVFFADFIWNRFKLAGNIPVTGFILSVLITACMIYPSGYLIKTTGSASGFLSGIILEKKYINYLPSGNILTACFNFITGGVILGLLFLGSTKLLPESAISTVATYMLSGLWLTYGAPAIFALIGRLKKNEL